MRRALVIIMAAMLLCSFSMAEEQHAEGIVVIPASDAAFKKEKGVTFENKMGLTEYDSEHGMIVNIGKDARIAFTVPEGVEGSFDIYITVSKILAQFSSQPFSFSVNGEEPWSVPLDCQVSADSPAKYDKDGSEYNTGTIYDTGRFLVAENIQLKSGDTVEVIGTYGAKAPKLRGMAFPGVVSMTLAPAGTPVTVGYDYTLPEKEAVDPDDILSGKNIIWIGSSVTYGAQSGGHYSMVEAVRELHPALTCEKYAISGTTLVNNSEDSYVARLKRIPKSKHPDLIVVQLSTNDATQGKPFGEIADGYDMSEFDDTTIAGAIETIIAYSKETFGCPVCFYTGTFFKRENYGEMVNLLLEIQKKWDIGVIDMFNNPEMTAIYDTDEYHSIMCDEIHPYRKGYIEWWTPVIDAYLTDYMSSHYSK